MEAAPDLPGVENTPSVERHPLWREVRWVFYYTLYFVPACAVIALLDFLLHGRGVYPPDPFVWTLGILAALVSLWAAGMRDGFKTPLGQAAFLATLPFAIAYLMIRSGRSPGRPQTITLGFGEEKWWLAVATEGKAKSGARSYRIREGVIPRGASAGLQP